MAKLGLSSPWVIFYNEINAMFKDDPDIRIVYDEENNVINLYVDNTAKANAPTELLPVEKNFGAVTIAVNVIPANIEKSDSLKFKTLVQPVGNLFELAFEGNPHFVKAVHVMGVFNNPMTYILFKREVIQYFNDSLGDLHGVCSTLMQNIAENIFENRDGVYFCTDVFEDSIHVTAKYDSLFR